MTIENFVLHPDKGGSQRTDADILAVRFPYRQELDMNDHEIFLDKKRRIFIGIAEVKEGVCWLNGPWTKKERRNINRVLHSIGAFPSDIVDIVAQSLYEKTYFKDSNYIVRLIAIGKVTSQKLKDKYPELIQLTYKDHILSFIYERFREYRRQKADHKQWDETGQDLFEMVKTSSSLDDFLGLFKSLWNEGIK